MPVPIMFPIEITSRELDSRLLLAAHCVGPGCSVFLGQDRCVYRLARRWRSGIYVGKQILVGGLKPNLTKYRVLKSRGFRVVFLAEEEPVFSKEEVVDRRQFLQMFHPDWLDGDDIICAWGEFSAEVFRSVAKLGAAAIHVTGHPRFDLCKPELACLYEAETLAIQQRYGKFILLNTKFSLASNLPAFESFKNAFTGGKESGDTPEYMLHYHCYHARLQTAYIALANRLRKEFPNHHIVLRPHPGEDSAWYRTVLAGITNVSVLTEGSVLPWLAAAAVLVHTGCTTGLEAHQITPCIIHYAPEIGRAFDQYLPSLVGTVCGTEDEVVRCIARSAEVKLADESRHPIERIIANFAPQVVASARIGSLVKAEVEKMLGEQRHGKLAEWEHRLRQMMPARKALLAGPRVPRKFEGLNPALIRRKLLALEGLVGKRLKPRFVSSHLMELTQG